MSYFEESERVKIHLMQGGAPLVKILILKRTGIEQSLVVNKNTMLNGGSLSVEAWMVNQHGVWRGTTNQIDLPFPFLKAGVVYPFSCFMWDEPRPTEDRIAGQAQY
jgi:hypothetical protein